MEIGQTLDLIGIPVQDFHHQTVALEVSRAQVIREIVCIFTMTFLKEKGKFTVTFDLVVVKI